MASLMERLKSYMNDTPAKEPKKKEGELGKKEGKLAMSAIQKRNKARADIMKTL